MRPPTKRAIWFSAISIFSTALILTGVNANSWLTAGKNQAQAIILKALLFIGAFR